MTVPEPNRYYRVREAFCRANFPLPLPGEWCDLVATMPMPGRRVARLELVTLGTSDQYEGLDLTIAGVDTGRIERKLFRFHDHLHERVDSRSDQPARFHTWGGASQSEFGWYIAIPSTDSLERMMREIGKYIATWDCATPMPPRCEAVQFTSAHETVPGGTHGFAVMLSPKGQDCWGEFIVDRHGRSFRRDEDEDHMRDGIMQLGFRRRTSAGSQIAFVPGPEYRAMRGRQ